MRLSASRGAGVASAAGKVFDRLSGRGWYTLGGYGGDAGRQKNVRVVEGRREPAGFLALEASGAACRLRGARVGRHSDHTQAAWQSGGTSAGLEPRQRTRGRFVLSLLVIALRPVRSRSLRSSESRLESGWRSSKAQHPHVCPGQLICRQIHRPIFRCQAEDWGFSFVVGGYGGPSIG